MLSPPLWYLGSGSVYFCSHFANVEQKLTFLGLSQVVFTEQYPLYSNPVVKVLVVYILIYNQSNMGIKFPKIISPLVSQGKK